MSSKDLDQLKQQFSKQLVGKMDHLDELWMKYVAQNTPANLEALEFYLHKLIGTTGVYGYKALSKKLRKIETQVFALEESQVELEAVKKLFHDLKHLQFEVDAPEAHED